MRSSILEQSNSADGGKKGSTSGPDRWRSAAVTMETMNDALQQIHLSPNDATCEQYSNKINQMALESIHDSSLSCIVSNGSNIRAPSFAITEHSYRSHSVHSPVRPGKHSSTPSTAALHSRHAPCPAGYHGSSQCGHRWNLKSLQSVSKESKNGRIRKRNRRDTFHEFADGPDDNHSSLSQQPHKRRRLGSHPRRIHSKYLQPIGTTPERHNARFNAKNGGGSSVGNQIRESNKKNPSPLQLKMPSLKSVKNSKAGPADDEEEDDDEDDDLNQEESKTNIPAPSLPKKQARRMTAKVIAMDDAIHAKRILLRIENGTRNIQNTKTETTVTSGEPYFYHSIHDFLYDILIKSDHS